MLARRLAVVCAMVLLGSRAAPAQDAANNDPATCRELWEEIGLPRYNADEEIDATLVCHTRYVLSQSNVRKTPDWVVERLTKQQVTGSSDRPNVKFKPDPDVPDGSSAQPSDYAHSDFAIGHQAPSEDFNRNVDWMKDSFFFSNAVPQIGPGFNGGVWSGLEKRVRTLASRFRGPLYVITGPIAQLKRNKKVTISAADNSCENEITFGGDGNRPAICGADEKCPAGVAVPAALYKIVYDPQMGRANAYILPNIDHRGKYAKLDDYLDGFRTSVAMVEQYTDLTFFPALRRRATLVGECANTMLH